MASSGERSGRTGTAWTLHSASLLGRSGWKHERPSSCKAPAPLLIWPTPPPPDHADEATRKDLAVKRETVTPFWWALRTLLRYRTLKNYRSGEFLGPRVADKLIFS